MRRPLPVSVRAGARAKSAVCDVTRSQAADAQKTLTDELADKHTEAIQFIKTKYPTKQRREDKGKAATVNRNAPADFEVAVRVARRLWKFSDAEISFAGSSESTRVEFVAWVKGKLRQFEKKGRTSETVVVRARSGIHFRTREKSHCLSVFPLMLQRGHLRGFERYFFGLSVPG